MALVGVLSTMLLHDRFVASPQLADPLVPDRVVVGDELRVVPQAHDRRLTMTPPVRLLHESCSPPPSASPSARPWSAGAERLAYSELLDRSLRLARALQDLGARARRPRRDLHGQLGRLRHRRLRGHARRRRLRRRQPADEGGQAPVRPRRLRGGRRPHGGQPDPNCAGRGRFGPERQGRRGSRSARGRRGRARLRGGHRLGGAGAARRRHDPGRPRGAHLHVGEHGLPEGRDDDPPEHGLRRREHRPVPAARARRAHPRAPPARLRLRPLPAAHERAQGRHARSRALVRLPGADRQARRGGGGRPSSRACRPCTRRSSPCAGTWSSSSPACGG